jgi:glycosyltransferase involved in cell wall biosynthesis
VIVAIVPALNEAERIGGVLASMPARVERIVVIDDGSTDGTGAIAARDSRVEVIAHGTRRGVGAAIATGCLRARELGADVAVVLAGDGQMDPRDLDAVVAPVIAREADVVKGNRLQWPGGAIAFPLPRLLGVIAFAAATRIATGLSIDDAQCGYVAFSPRALAELPWSDLWRSFGYPNDLLSRAARLGLRIDEVPVRPIYAGEQSKLGVRHLPGIAFVLTRALIARATS